MVWKRLAWVGCLAPLVSGCNIFYYAARNVVNEPIQAVNNVSRTHHLRKDARAAWREVREQYPRKCFSEEFRDGFVDGYVDYLDRGGNATPPLVPPIKYTRNHYLTAEGHLLIRDYFIGFKYGLDVAVATGQRQFLVVPVMLPEQPTGPASFNIQPHADAPDAAPLGRPRPVVPAKPAVPSSDDPPIPKPKPPEPAKQPQSLDKPRPGVPFRPPAAPTAAVPPKPVAPLDPASSKFGHTAVISTGPGSEAADRLPPPTPRLPEGGSLPVKLPEPPPEVPTLPDHVPTPSVLDDLPVHPANPGGLPAAPSTPGALPGRR